MENNELCIKVKIGSSDTLVGFPYQPSQYFACEEDDTEDTITTWLVIDLAERPSTTVNQEMFLDSHPNVIEWTVR